MTPPRTRLNASRIDAYADGIFAAWADWDRIVPECFTPRAAIEWLRGYDEETRLKEIAPCPNP
jgi:hypothetical protein